jgi:hypothetical protein
VHYSVQVAALTVHPYIAFWLSFATTAAALFIVVANVIYVRKFLESVDIQKKAAQGGLLLQINNQFFYSEPHKKIIRILEEGKNLRANDMGISDEDLDDHIGMLDTIGTFVRTGILQEDLVYELFSHYVESAHESPEISDYVNQLHQHDGSLFSDFEWLYERMKEHRATKRQPAI